MSIGSRFLDYGDTRVFTLCLGACDIALGLASLLAGATTQLRRLLGLAQISGGENLLVDRIFRNRIGDSFENLGAI